MTLEKKQLDLRVKRALAALEDVTDPEQRVQAFAALGAVHKADSEEAVRGFGSLDEAREEILNGLFERAKKGDAPSARAFAEISTDKAPPERFNIVVSVTPAVVPDSMLKACCMNAMPFHVDEGLEGLEMRMELDEAPHELRELGRRFRVEFMEWAERAYKPRDA